ncbi:curli production assembly/transport protein CsgG [Stutzerimonas decontaminans]|jgi:curli production assembly/transport component CsgG|uniref:Curli production assembly/transport component CsgG n=1 Tax=Stutzerimonas decontaminans TaxID=3022791 RepID=A0ABX4W1W1_9GAMM|nr:CsgG/HfaB family protein [Stutzerimonas decontaminans]MCQ4245974.1 curli production assembly/transport protein CsgG [Stutzerimonas decontaminans]PNF86449.1 curli production assembly/transport protein CsgG [Stutzerimonas decontaminans]
MRSLFVAIGMMAVLQGCAVREPMSADQHPPTLTPRTSTYQDLLALPRPKGPLVAAVYGFRDQTGQYKPTPASSFSTAVTQGAASMLVDAMQASGWFVVLEREGLQNVLTERKIIRASQAKPDVAPNIQSELPSLLAANIIMEGAIVAYETNVRSGGQGARYLGIGLSQEYRVDQVTVNLRAIDVRSGRVLSNVMTTKTIFSIGRSANVYKFIEFKELLEAEAGYTTNEPAQLCVLSAIEAAVAHLIAQGVDRRLWHTAEGTGSEHPELSKYLSKLD